MPTGSFTLDAFIQGERWKHHRQRDHTGADSDLYVMLSTDVGKYPAFTPIHYVLADLVARLIYLEDYRRTYGSFTIDATISTQVITLEATIRATVAGSFTLDAEFIHMGSFTLDAFIQAFFTLDAFIV